MDENRIQAQRGSPERLPRRCGNYLKRTEPARYCKRHPARGRKKCKFHGGSKKVGAASPNFTHGQRSELYRPFLGGALLKGYEALQTDDELVSNQEDIRLWTGRQLQLVERLGATGVDGSGDWCALRETCRDVEAAAARADETGSEKDRRALARAMEAHSHAVHEVVDREQVWEDLASCSVTLMKLRREERRLQESRHLSMSVDKVLYLAALLTAVAMKYITDPAERAKFAEDARLLADGHSVEIEEELLAAVPFGNLRFGRN
ncbi:MAG: hypothetical protein IID05_04535 [Gemmatimonadetes bacterium]|nr:hypothetical protein [Gemmatimonadota bacterium]